MNPGRRPYHACPLLVPHAGRFAHALMHAVTDPGLRTLPLVGSVDQWADSTNLLDQSDAVRATVRAIR
ncbi:hypothetical protein [Streptomyces sp. NPDC053728]|uniref:hypothetical protein n=1 Tax=unclassified Streptomyces TaxID=2593676 RepID=UPI003419254F